MFRYITVKEAAGKWELRNGEFKNSAKKVE